MFYYFEWMTAGLFSQSKFPGGAWAPRFHRGGPVIPQGEQYSVAALGQ